MVKTEGPLNFCVHRLCTQNVHVQNFLPYLCLPQGHEQTGTVGDNILQEEFSRNSTSISALLNWWNLLDPQY